MALDTNDVDVVKNLIQDEVKELKESIDDKINRAIIDERHGPEYEARVSGIVGDVIEESQKAMKKAHRKMMWWLILYNLLVVAALSYIALKVVGNPFSSFGQQPTPAVENGSSSGSEKLDALIQKTFPLSKEKK